jgi:hypothetical protein
MLETANGLTKAYDRQQHPRSSQRTRSLWREENIGLLTNSGSPTKLTIIQCIQGDLNSIKTAVNLHFKYEVLEIMITIASSGDSPFVLSKMAVNSNSRQITSPTRLSSSSSSQLYSTTPRPLIKPAQHSTTLCGCLQCSTHRFRD